MKNIYFMVGTILEVDEPFLKEKKENNYFVDGGQSGKKHIF